MKTTWPALTLELLLMLAPVAGAAQFSSSGDCQPTAQDCGANMVKVRAALRNAEDLWKFITSPETAYVERNVAAVRGASLFSTEWIPEILKAKLVLQKENSLHGFGVQLHPYDARGSRRGTPRASLNGRMTRTILSHEFVVPDKWIEYPQTDQQRSATPWPYQVAQIVDQVYDFVVTHADPKRIERIALTLPCEDYFSAHELIGLTFAATNKLHDAGPETFATWLNALHNYSGKPAVERATIGITNVARYLNGDQSRKAWAMVQVIGLEELGTGDNEHILRLMEAFPNVRPVPYTLVLAAARFLVGPEPDPRFNMNFSRAVWASVLLKELGESSIPIPTAVRNLNASKMPDHEAFLGSFRSWFRQNETILARRAEAEQPLIEEARATMTGRGACRSRQPFLVR